MKLCFHFTKNKIVKLKTNVKSRKKLLERKFPEPLRGNIQEKIAERNIPENLRGKNQEKNAGKKILEKLRGKIQEKILGGNLRKLLGEKYVGGKLLANESMKYCRV